MSLLVVVTKVCSVTADVWFEPVNTAFGLDQSKRRANFLSSVHKCTQKNCTLPKTAF
jgi:hypothetical protein